MNKTHQTSSAMGFDINELMIERDLKNEELIAAAIGRIRNEMKGKLRSHTAITIFLAVPSYIAEAVEARMRDAQRGSGRSFWVVRKQATRDGGFQFSFEPSSVDSRFGAFPGKD